MNTYIHKTDHRLRVRSDFIRRNPSLVNDLIIELNKIDAIQLIKHKKHAGSVAIMFDPKELDCESLLEILESHDWLKGSTRPTIIEDAVSNGVKTLTQGLAAMALKRLISPLFSRVILNA